MRPIYHADLPPVQSKIIYALVVTPKSTGFELPFLCCGDHIGKQMYVFKATITAVRKGVDKMYPPVDTHLS